MRAYLLEEELQLPWDYQSVGGAAKFLDGWCSKVMRSRIEPMKRVRSFRVHRELRLDWFRAQGEAPVGIAEGPDDELEVLTTRAYGLRTSMPRGATRAPGRPPILLTTPKTSHHE